MNLTISGLPFAALSPVWMVGHDVVPALVATRLRFQCPCLRAPGRLGCAFRGADPLLLSVRAPLWQTSGDRGFDDLTLTPSVRVATDDCGVHFSVIAGKVVIHPDSWCRRPA